MMGNAASSESQNPSQSIALVRRILSVAEILARASQETVENGPENSVPSEVRYCDLKVPNSEG